jgi:AcrR family transcriptional regulator
MGVKERRAREGTARLDAILSAAEKVFARDGYQQARMEDIAETAELAKGTLYYYFKSKDEIFSRLLERESGKVLEEIRRRIPESSTFREALDQTILFYLEYFEANRGFLKMVLPSMCGFIRFGDADIVRRSTKGFDAHAEFVREALRSKIKRERLPFSADDLQVFLKTLQLGIGMEMLEGRRDEAQAAARFFLDLTKRVLEKRS